MFRPGFGMRTIAALAASIALSGCVAIAVAVAPSKKPKPSDKDIAKTAINLFRQTLEDGEYEELPNVIEFLSAAYIDDPADPEIAFFLGMSHLWRFTERERLPRQARIVEHIVLADKFLGEARRLAPHDARVEGFDSIAELVDGMVHQDEGLKRHGYFTLNDAVSHLPSFNLFVTSFVFGVMHRDDGLFRRAVNSTWDGFSLCTGLPIDPARPDFEPQKGRIRELSLGLPKNDPERTVCTDSPKAPFTIEGILLNMGDILVKDGRPAIAKQAYALARSSVNFQAWPYAPVLEQRIVDADSRSEAYLNKAKDEPVPMASSSMACAGCHSRKPPANSQVPAPSGT